MESKLEAAVLQTDIAIGEPDRNFDKLREWMERAVNETERKPDVLVLPEMWNTGYALERIDELADSGGERTMREIGDFCREHGVHAIAGSIALKHERGVSNTVIQFDRNGEPAARYSKIHLFRLMDEHKHLTAGDAVGETSLDGTRAGIAICYDIRFPELARKLALGGAKVLFVPAQWPHPRLHHWRTLITARAIENQMFVVACNRAGTSGETSFCGHSMIVDPWGETLAEAGEEETIVRATLDIGLVDRVRAKIPVFADRRPELYT